MPRPPKPVSQSLAEEVRRYRPSLRDLARRTGVDASALSRFLSGERGLRLDAVDALCRVLGLRLVRGDAKM